MKTYWLLTVSVLISVDRKVLSDNNDSEEVYEENSSTVVNLLNRTYIHINGKINQLEIQVHQIEHPNCDCNATEVTEVKREISSDLRNFSKVLSGFENEIRLLKNDLSDLREMFAGASTATTTITTVAPRVCEFGWISSQEKCYFFSYDSDKREWAPAIDRCTSMGAKLVEVKTDKEAQFLVENYASNIGDYDLVYTGRRRNDEDVWVFLSNDERVDTSVRSWANNEPSGETCGCAKKANGFLMQDCVCDGYGGLYFICEIVR
ncbi:uncharacterized protein LOC117329645 isoform X2 [Pecten maximus]|uniref:uncharacterized protein LOC117329645 isoform X2 n=1 Tax=Pecten maximus TaxID=6579 RepID=UPI00145801D3|nr:uncharacterized protein LOC117329645 isoform X2 [Pecten maximus]